MRPCSLALLIVLLGSPLAAAASFEFTPADPAKHGFAAEKLDVLRESLARQNTKALLILRNDRLVLEWYAEGAGPDKPHYTASMAKGIVGGLSLALAIQDQLIKPDDFAATYIPEWKEDPRKSKITIAHLATHASGIEDAEQDKVAHDQLTGWKGDFWKRNPDPFTISRDLAPVLDTPGERVRYSNPGMAMLAYAVTAALQRGEHKDLRTLLRERVYGPIGIDPKHASIGYNQTYRVNDLNLVANWGGGSFSPRATLRIGRLLLREGDWEGRRLLDPAVLRQCVHYAGGPKARQWEGPSSPRPAFGFWTNRDKAFASAPRDTYLAAGAGHQLLIVIPSLDMVIVRNGGQISPKEPFWSALSNHLLAPLMAAVTDPPYPPSDVIRRVRFDARESIIRSALDSDNWPITWGDDDQLYASYGDGRRFEPHVQPKLSLGLARIEGAPPDFRGINLRSESAERVGDGDKGPKASGMLMVDGVLYMWVRNTANSTLAWSHDRGKTWRWGWKFEESFGCPTFLNVGRNHAGAPDEYVYTYSQDGPTAYEPSDGIVLARVNRTLIRERNAYEFFCRLDNESRPVWTPNLKDRGHIFRYPKHCERLDAVYVPALKRYLLAVGYGHDQGWGLFDAPTPYGRWTTAFHTRDWDIAHTHGYRLPTKWISADAKTMWLLFSGRGTQGFHYDAFSLRRVALDFH